MKHAPSAEGRMFWRESKQPLNKFIDNSLAAFEKRYQKQAEIIYCHASVAPLIKSRLRIVICKVNPEAIILC